MSNTAPDLLKDWHERKHRKHMEEIERTGKYPAVFNFLPPIKNQGSDNKRILDLDPDPLEVFEGTLRYKRHVLGHNKRRFSLFVKPVEFGVLYVINAVGTSLYKVGISTNFDQRNRVGGIPYRGPTHFVGATREVIDNPVSPIQGNIIDATAI